MEHILSETPDVTSIQTHLHSKLKFFKEGYKTGYYNHTMMGALFKTKLITSRGRVVKSCRIACTLLPRWLSGWNNSILKIWYKLFTTMSTCLSTVILQSSPLLATNHSARRVGKTEIQAKCYPRVVKI